MLLSEAGGLICLLFFQGCWRMVSVEPVSARNPGPRVTEKLCSLGSVYHLNTLFCCVIWEGKSVNPAREIGITRNSVGKIAIYLYPGETIIERLQLEIR